MRNLSNTIITHKKSVVNQREVGVDVTSFAEALRRALRQDPDVILVGELRDLETMEAAITAAETGHLVFWDASHDRLSGVPSTVLSTRSPSVSRNRSGYSFSTNLIAVLSQTLCPLKKGKGRAAAFEFMVVTPAIANLIRENKVYRIESSIQTGKKFGMQLLDDHLWELYDVGKISRRGNVRQGKDTRRTS